MNKGAISHNQNAYESKLALSRLALDSADGVIANLRDFRGTEPDAGTVFEVGYAHARGIPVIGYGVPARCYATRVGDREACGRDRSGTLRELANGREVEDFGQPLNLMLACSVELVPHAAAAMAALALVLNGKGLAQAQPARSAPVVLAAR